MRNVRDVKQGVNQYLDQTRPKRQRTTGYFAFFLISLFVAYLFGRNDMSKELGKIPQVYAADVQVSETTSNNVDQNQCSLPGEFPAPEYQTSWDKILSHCEAIESSSVQWGFEPELIASIIMIESGGESSAISQSGAIGLMQIMSSDGLSGQLYGDYFSNRPTVIELLDPRFNIDWGTSFLASLLKSYGDNIREALFHYGPANVGYEGYADKVLSVYNSVTDAN